MNLNKVFLIGRLTQDPEVRNTSTGQTVASFSMATNRTWTDKAGAKQEQAEFHNIVVWARLAEVAGQYLKKGQTVMVEGRLQTRNWVGQDGVKRYRTEVVAENFQMGPKAVGSGTAAAGGANNFAPKPAAVPVAPIDEIPVIQVEEAPLVMEEAETVTGDEEVVPF
ncbi:MAG: single-stranded DNA-binding protein [Patescibacteria group bacterium]|nr:single-stranded DNA-binding protein [Patescibacteria group bacterium]